FYANTGIDGVTVNGLASSSDQFAVSGTTVFANSISFASVNVENWTLDGKTGTDTLTGENKANAWSITAVDGGTPNGSYKFAGIENLIGGTQVDTFTLSGTGSLSGFIQGGAGSDKLQGRDVTNTWSISGADAGTVTNVGAGFSGVENLVGGSQVD